MPDSTEKQADRRLLQKRNQELKILNAIARALNAEKDLTAALNTTLREVARLLDLESGWIWLLQKDGTASLGASLNLPPALVENPLRMSGDCYCLRTFREEDENGAARVNFITCSRLKDLLDDTDGLRYHASIPLYAGERKIGILNSASRDRREFAPEELQLLNTIGDLLSIAIERSELTEKERRMAVVAERNRLARDIHDTLAQGLTAIALKLESADAVLGDRPEAATPRSIIRQSLQLTRENLEEARRSVQNLRSQHLDEKSLTEALPNWLKRTAATLKLNLEYKTMGSPLPLSVATENALFRTAQEALRNIGRHADASQVRVELNFQADQVTLAVDDDGCGFDPEQLPAQRFGLLGMNERLKLLGGILEIQSAAGEGTRLIASIPIKKKGQDER